MSLVADVQSRCCRIIPVDLVNLLPLPPQEVIKREPQTEPRDCRLPGLAVATAAPCCIESGDADEKTAERMKQMLARSYYHHPDKQSMYPLPSPFLNYEHDTARIQRSDEASLNSGRSKKISIEQSGCESQDHNRR